MSTSMNDALKYWSKAVSNDLDARGINVTIVNGHQPESYSINLDSDRFVGTICFWPGNNFEIQFNDCHSGEVILLETASFDVPEELQEYLNQLIFEKLVIYSSP